MISGHISNRHKTLTQTYTLNPTWQLHSEFWHRFIPMMAMGGLGGGTSNLMAAASTSESSHWLIVSVPAGCDNKPLLSSPLRALAWMIHTGRTHQLRRNGAASILDNNALTY
jgi:hypothetical protein